MSITKRSLSASVAGQQKAKTAFARKGWTQDNLALAVNLKTRQPIWRFFTGRPIERHTFFEICSLLDLNWQEIAENPPAEILENSSNLSDEVENIDINFLVQQVRSKRSEQIQHRCGYLTLLDLPYPVNINDIYIDVDLLELINSKPWIEIEKIQNWTLEKFDHFSHNQIYYQKISGIKAAKTYTKLRVLGQPGSGKTIFLQHLAILCNQGKFVPNRVPIFINLRDFSDEYRDTQKFSLLNFISSEFITYKINNPTLIQRLLHNGRILLLLDGLDEISAQDFPHVVQEIRRFSEKYCNNLFIVSCRTAAQEFKIKGFTDVEIAPLSEEKIIQFAQKWLAAFRKTDSEDGFKQAIKFSEELSRPENLKFRQLAVRPLFLYIACLILSHSEEFTLKFTNFSKLCLDSLLGKWDQSKNIQRDEVYPGFSLAHQLKFFRQLAVESFEQGKYFFEKQKIQQYISRYLCDLANDRIDPDKLQVDSEVVLKAIELQYGILIERVPDIFSFSFFAFKEYFTEQQIPDHYDFNKFEQNLSDLASKISKSQQHEVFLLTPSMLKNVDAIITLIKQSIEGIVSHDSYLEELLTWANQQSLDLETLKTEMTKSGNPDHNCNLNNQQQLQALKYYQTAHHFLLDCLNNNREIKESIRQNIQASFFFTAHSQSYQ